MTYWKHVTSASGKGKSREVKNGQKRKYFELEVTQGHDSWVEFAKEALAYHGKMRYEVLSRKPFSIKILAPPKKSKRYAYALQSSLAWQLMVAQILLVQKMSWMWIAKMNGIK